MKKNLRTLSAAALALTLSLAGTMTALAGTWRFDGPENWQWTYVKDDGTSPVSSWEQIDGAWYHFDANSYLDIGYTYDNDYDAYYYLDTTDGSNLGKMATSGQWEYGYIEPSGKVHCYLPGYAPYTFEGSVYLYEPDQYDEATQHNALVAASTSSWYNETYNGLAAMLDYSTPEGEVVTSQFQLPDNWREVCPYPFMRELVGAGVNANFDYDSDSYTMNSWEIDENNVLHVTAYWVTVEDEIMYE